MPFFQHTASIQVGRYWYLPIDVQSLDESFMLINVTTRQERPGFNDDIIVYIFDKMNFLKYQKHADARANNRGTIGLDPYQILVFAKSYWSTLYFKPPGLGMYYLVLDNSHSGQTSKIVDTTIYREYEHSQVISTIRKGFESNGWSDLWAIYDKAITYALLGDHSSACDNLRKLLIISWTRICEELSKTKISIPEGKSVDVKPLEAALQNQGIPSHITSFISRTWSLISELAHIEKKDGQQPTPNETNLAINATVNALAFIIQLFEQKSKGKTLKF